MTNPLRLFFSAFNLSLSLSPTPSLFPFSYPSLLFDTPQSLCPSFFFFFSLSFYILYPVSVSSSLALFHPLLLSPSHYGSVNRKLGGGFFIFSSHTRPLR